jgi:hypothetical protein
MSSIVYSSSSSYTVAWTASRRTSQEHQLEQRRCLHAPNSGSKWQPRLRCKEPASFHKLHRSHCHSPAML